MMQANSSTAARNFNPLTDGDGISAGISQYASLATPVQVVDMDAAVNRVLASAKRKTEQDMPGGETGMRPDSLLDHTRSCSRTVPVVDFPPPPAPRPRTATFHALQEWEGHVARIDADEFVAQLVDLTAGHSHESEEAVIPMAEISEHDASCMAVGSIFRWVIGYERSPEGTRKRVSQIVFRDLPRMTANDLAHGAAWARKVASALGS